MKLKKDIRQWETSENFEMFISHHNGKQQENKSNYCKNEIENEVE